MQTKMLIWCVEKWSETWWKEVVIALICSWETAVHTLVVECLLNLYTPGSALGKLLCIPGWSKACWICNSFLERHFAEMHANTWSSTESYAVFEFVVTRDGPWNSLDNGNICPASRTQPCRRQKKSHDPLSSPTRQVGPGHRHWHPGDGRAGPTGLKYALFFRSELFPHGFTVCFFPWGSYWIHIRLNIGFRVCLYLFAKRVADSSLSPRERESKQARERIYLPSFFAVLFFLRFVRTSESEG